MTDISRDDSYEPIQTFRLPDASQRTDLSLSTSSASTAGLSKGVYMLITDADCYIARGSSVSTSNGMPFKVAMNGMMFSLEKGDRVAGILASGGPATLTLVKM